MHRKRKYRMNSKSNPPTRDGTRISLVARDFSTVSKNRPTGLGRTTVHEVQLDGKRSGCC
jgi:hypothetical protein